MKAWLLDSLGGLDRLRLADVPEPQAGAGEVILALQFAALNPADRYLAEGQYPARPAFPHILGRDGLGTILSGPQSGEKRIILRGETGVTRHGTFAERVAVPQLELVEIPTGWTDEEAAGAPLVYLTAYQALTQWGDLPERSVILITGASGGVGVAAVQLGKAMGHEIVALSRSATKGETLRKIGADHVLNPSDPGWPKALVQSLGDRRVDLAIDNIGGEGFNDLLYTLGGRARVSVVGRLAGPVPQFNTASLFFRRIRIGGVSVGTYTPDESRAAWSKIVELLQKTNARPLVDSVHPFDRLLDAFKRLEQGPMGKVLLRVA
jgi:NADPH2:quinone reductase